MLEWIKNPGKAFRQAIAARRLARGLEARSAKQLRSPGFAGASIDRLSASLNTWSNAVNADLDGSLVILRSRARSLANNTEHGRRFLSLVAANVVGQGPRLQVRARNVDGSLDKGGNDAIEVAWDRWTRRADIGGRMGWAHFLRVLVKAVARDGEALVKVVRNRRLPFGMALQLLEADRLDEGVNGVLSNGNTVRMGVEIDSVGRPVAYHVKSSHPGESWQRRSPVTERVDARDMFHVFLQERAEQVRGFTWFHAVLQRMNMLHAYEEAAVVAARVGASKMGVFTRKDDTGSALESMADGRTSDGQLQMNAEPGEFIELPAGYDLSSWNPEYPHANFESFLKACMRGVASGLDVATHNISGDMTDVNYSSARIAELSERDMWVALQDWLGESFLVPLYQDWLGSALLLQQVQLDPSGRPLPVERLGKFLEVSRFQGRRWAWVDPLKEVEASQKLIEAGLSSRTAIAASQGREFEDIVDELAQEQEYAMAQGLDLTADGPGGPDIQDDTQDPAEGRQIVVNVAPPSVNVSQPSITVNVPERELHVDASSEITVPEREVHLEATVEAPTVNVAAPQVHVKAFPAETEELIERDDRGEMKRVVRKAKG